MSHIVKQLSPRQQKSRKELRREFQLIGGEEGSGYSFPCKPDGSPDTSAMNYECWKENFDNCLAHPGQYEDQGVVAEKWMYMEPAVALCSCGEKVYLDGDTRCACGQWYNQCGQELLYPEYWGESEW